MNDTNTHRFYLIDRGSTTEKTLAQTEDAGTRILSAFKSLQAFSKPGELNRINYQEHLVGFTVLPVINLMAPQLAASLRQQITQGIKDTFQEEAVKLAGHTGAVILPQVEMGGYTFDARIFTEPVSVIAHNFVCVGFDRNIVARLAAADPRHHQGSNAPGKAVLTLSGHSVYPEARNVFANWILKLPASIEQLGNSYVPPNATQLSPQQLQDITMGIDFGEFRADHHAARERLTKLPVIQTAARFH